MGRIAVLFSGQGSQYAGMGKYIYSQYSEVAELFERASDILDYSLPELCFGAESKKINETQFSQVAIFVVSVSYYRILQKHYNITPAIFCGHSLGEYAALVCANMLSFDDCVSLLQQRAYYMQQAAQQKSGGMAAIIGFGVYEVMSNVCRYFERSGKYLCIAIRNSSEQVVISGDIDAIEYACRIAKTCGFQAKQLRVSGAFHSSHMINAKVEFEQILKMYSFTPPSQPILSSLSGKKIDISSIRSNLAAQLCMPVQWYNCVKQMIESDVSLYIECGPRQTLKKIVKEINSDLEVYSFDDKNDQKQLIDLCGD